MIILKAQGFCLGLFLLKFAPVCTINPTVDCFWGIIVLISIFSNSIR